MITDDSQSEIESSVSGVSNPGVIDLFAFDAKSDEVVLVINEPRPWDGSDDQLHQLQEKFNAYASFLLDGEMATAHPELAGKKARIELRCTHTPNDGALSLLSLIHDQLAFQEIRLEVIVSQKCGCAESTPGECRDEVSS